MKHRILFFFAVGCIGLIEGNTAHALDRHVPASYPSIQSAINASSNGDTIYVSPGTYLGCINIINKYVSLKASSSSPNDTVLTGCPFRTIMMIQNVPYRAGVPRVTIDGFRFANGNSPEGQGGAITIANYADPVIQNNYFVGNRSNVDGGAILVYNHANPIIKSNYFNDNWAMRLGGAIFAVKYCAPVIYGNTISQNHATGGSIPGGGPSGGAIYMENDITNTAARVKPVISNNVITDNHADHGGGAIMLRIGVDTIIENNQITYNSAAFGGGIHIETEGSYPIVSNNTISNNIAPYSAAFNGSGYGGGIAVWNTSYPKIMYNTIASNQSTNGGGGVSLAENSNSALLANKITTNSVTGAVASSTNYFGGGIYIANASAAIANNVVASNTAGIGGGIASLDNAVYTLTNNTLASNTALSTVNTASGGGIYVGSSPGSRANFVNNIIANNNNYQIFEGSKLGYFTSNHITTTGKGMYFNWSTGGINNAVNLDNSSGVNASGTTSDDPLFTDGVQGDYSIASTSPAKDSGYAVSDITSDFRRAIRPYNNAYDRGAYEYTTEPQFKTPVYRFWSAENRGHFYTNSANEKDSVLQTYPIQSWRYESEAYDAYTTQVAGSVPVYRFWSAENRGHFYTIDPSERDYIIANYTDNQWHYEGIAYYVLDLSSPTGSTVYRFWSPVFMHHFYTADAGERDYVQATMSTTWVYEGPRFKVP